MESAEQSGSTPEGRQPARSPADAFVAAILGWAVPGAGHAYIGRVPKGLLLGGSVIVVFVAGMLIGGPGVVSYEHKPIWFWGHIFGGICTGGAYLFGTPHIAADPDAAHELGVLYTCVAALCNFLLALDAAATAWRDAHPPATRTAPPPAPPKPVEVESPA